MGFTRSLPFGAFSLLVAGIVGFVGCGGSKSLSEAGAPGGTGGPETGGAGFGGIAGTGGMAGDGAIPAQGGGGMVGFGGGPGGASGGTGGSVTPTCGEAGLPCCDGNACNGGGCCVIGLCMAAGGSCVGLGGGTCANGVCGNCGGLGMICCASSTGAGACTSAGTLCNNGSCSPCGELGSPCCARAGGGAGQCKGANAICNDKNVCMACGTPGSPCCPGSQCNSPGCCYDNLCTGEGLSCGTSGGTCQAGRCSGCGSASQACCAGNVCYERLLCKSGTCTPCGALGQGCCPASTSAATCQAGMACTGDGVCARCGTPGDICCAGDSCTGGCCQNGRCMAASACPTTPDGGTADAPQGGSDGNRGTGGVTGTGGGGGGGGTGGTTTPWTVPAGCGDGVVAAPERCDDGNTLPFDGCSSDCQVEPTCAGTGPCTSTCGDGIVVGEECDDGNVVNGDGCSSTCKVELGFTCAQPLGESVLVPAVYRDFKYGKPTDFEPGVTGSIKAATGMVKPSLDADGKPEYASPASPPTNVHVASATTFASWYRNTDGVNHATASKLVLWDNHHGAYVNRYGANGEQWPVTQTAYYCGAKGQEVLDDQGNPIPCTDALYISAGIQSDCDKLTAQGYTLLRCLLDGTVYKGMYITQLADGTPLFFPVDDDPLSASEKALAAIPSEPKGMYDATGTWPDEGDVTGNDRKHNFSFTSEIRYWFRYEAGQSYTLDVVGDDDVWLFVNKKLAVDLGGIHTPVAGSVTVDDTTAPTYGLAPGNVYEVEVFQAERQSTASTFKLTLPGFSLAPSVCQRN